ncbi:hypothetical protein KI387_011399, partial [Taxus chinensis]
ENSAGEKIGSTIMADRVGNPAHGKYFTILPRLRCEAEAGARGLIWPSRYAGIQSWNAKWVFVDGKPKKKFH